MINGKRELATFNEDRRTVGKLHPKRDTKQGTYRGGEKGRHLRPRRFQKIAEGKPILPSTS